MLRDRRRNRREVFVGDLESPVGEHAIFPGIRRTFGVGRRPVDELAHTLIKDDRNV